MLDGRLTVKNSRRAAGPPTFVHSRGGFGGRIEEGAVILPDQAVRIVIATKSVEFRKGHDGLAAMAHADLGFAPKAAGIVTKPVDRQDM